MRNQFTKEDAEDSVQALIKLRPSMKLDNLKAALMSGDKDFSMWFDLVVTEFPHLSKQNQEKGLDALQKVIEKNEKITTEDMTKLLTIVESMCPLLKK